jgi:hypothetical protein
MVDRKINRRLLWVLVILVGLCLCAGAVFWGFVFVKPRVDVYMHQEQFDSTVWKTRPSGGDAMWPVRLCMVNDLMQQYLLDSQPRARVEELLGLPDQTEYFHEWDMVYLLGPERGYIRIDSEWLVLRLSPAGKVIEYRIVRD